MPIISEVKLIFFKSYLSEQYTKYTVYFEDVKVPSTNPPNETKLCCLVWYSIQEEIKCRLKVGNSCYYSVQTLLSSRLLSR